MKTCFETDINGYPIVLLQQGDSRLTVKYREHTREDLTYAAAAAELGECILHALMWESKLEMPESRDLPLG